MRRSVERDSGGKFALFALHVVQPKLIYCSVRDWTRFFTPSDQKVSGFTRPHVIGFVADIFFSTLDLLFSTLESGFIFFRIR